MGSYLAILEREGFPPVRAPFEIARLEDEVLRIPLFDAAEIGDGFVYVPAGKAILGGDPRALAPLPLREVFVDGFFMQRREVSFREYFTYLRELEETHPEEAQSRGPRDAQGVGTGTTRYWQLDESGRIEPRLPRGADLEFSVIGVSYDDARAYCRWLESRSAGAHAFDLPTEEEWERASRGADGRLFTWGDSFEWTFARLGLSAEISGLLPSGLYPTDESVYGILDLNGNVREWCLGSEREPWRILRGGAWGLRVEEDCHLASRANKREPAFVDTGSGFRVVKRRRGGS
jgi:serine/threonine-protein kinase